MTMSAKDSITKEYLRKENIKLEKQNEQDVSAKRKCIKEITGWSVKDTSLNTRQPTCI